MNHNWSELRTWRTFCSFKKLKYIYDSAPSANDKAYDIGMNASVYNVYMFQDKHCNEMK